MKININTNIPDSTYFAMSDVTPEIDSDGNITIYSGKGKSRSWGAPQVTSTVVLEDCDLVAIHVGFSHKHRGGQGWHYFTTDGQTTRKVTWAQLPDETRQRILNNENKAPRWAKTPGKLKSQAIKPAAKMQTAYKLVRVDGDKLISLYDGEVEYKLGKRLAQKAADDHQGGWYSHPSVEQVKSLLGGGNLVPSRCLSQGMTLAMLRCEIGGTIIDYPNGKKASTYLTPVEVIEQIAY